MTSKNECDALLNAQYAFLQQINSLGKDPKYSDLIISCKHDFHVHRAIVLPQSEKLAEAVQEERQGTDIKVINLSATDEPHIVAAMVQFFYEQDYDAKKKDPELDSSYLEFELKVYAIGHKYRVSALVSRALERAKQRIRFAGLLNLMYVVDGMYAKKYGPTGPIENMFAKEFAGNMGRLFANDNDDEVDLLPKGPIRLLYKTMHECNQRFKAIDA